VLLTAFGIFCSLTILIPASIYGYFITATVPLEAELTSVRGIVLLGDANAADLSTSVTDGNTVQFPENYVAATNDTSQAIITFADDSSLTLYGNTTIVLHASKNPRFGLSSNPSQITIEVKKGRVRATAARDQADLNFQVFTPHASAQLSQGSYSIEVNGEETQVTTRFGVAEVSGDDGSVTLSQGQRAVLHAKIC
jgi:ferric-dicitrate binding protein FerR (iron transport regulator)